MEHLAFDRQPLRRQLTLGWRVEGDAAERRAVPYLVRGHPGWLLPDVRYAVPLTPAWCTLPSSPGGGPPAPR